MKNTADGLIQVDGTVVIFDIETNGVARKLQGHTRQIQSLRYVASRDKAIVARY